MPKRFEVRFSVGAEADLDSIADYIAADSLSRAIHFIMTLRERTDNVLSLAPLSGKPLGQFRYLPFDNYVVAYTVNETDMIVMVQLVSEAHRDWQKLLR